VVLGHAARAAVNGDPAGARILHDYVLTMDKVKHYDDATAAFEAAAKNDPRLQADGRSMMTEPQRTFADIVAKFKRHPRLYAFYAKAGLTPFDTAAVPIALSYACLANRYPELAAKMADHTSATQISFCKAHMDEINALKTFRSRP
jgi:hypothetical protein